MPEGLAAVLPTGGRKVGGPLIGGSASLTMVTLAGAALVVGVVGCLGNAGKASNFAGTGVSLIAGTGAITTSGRGSNASCSGLCT